MNNASPTSKASPGEETRTSILILDLNRIFLTKEAVSERELMLASIFEGVCGQRRVEPKCLISQNSCAAEKGPDGADREAGPGW
jgi:hypothetical protein